MSVKKETLEKSFCEELERLQLKPQYVAMLHEIVFDVWKTKQAEAIATVGSVEKQIETIEEKKQLLVDAHVYKRSINEEVFRQQMERLEDEAAALRLQHHDAEAEDLNIEAALKFASEVLTNTAKLWMKMNLDQRQRLQAVLYPQGIVASNKGVVRTVATSPFFNVLREETEEEFSLAPPTGFEPVLLG